MWEILNCYFYFVTAGKPECGYNYSRAGLQDFSLFQSVKDAGRKQNYL